MTQIFQGYYQGGLISGASYANLGYPIRGGFVYNLFNTASILWYDNQTPTTTNNNFTTGSEPSQVFPTYKVATPGNYQFKAYFDISSILTSTSHIGTYEFYIQKNGTNIAYTSDTHSGSINIWKYINFDLLSSPVSLTTTDEIKFILKLSSFTSNNFTASISSGSAYCLPVTTPDLLFTISTGSAPFISGSIDGSGNGVNDTLVLNTDINSIYGGLYHPEYNKSPIISSSLYKKYGDVVTNFSLQKNDIVILRAINPSSGLQEYIYRILRSYVDSNKYYILLSGDLPSFLNINTYTTSTFEEVLFLRELPDETQIILSFNKKEGQTSYGFVIPDGLHPDVLKNINTITQQVKTKLIETGN